MRLPRSIYFLLLLSVTIGLTGSVFGQSEIAEIMRDRSIDWKEPQDRAQAVKEIRQIEKQNLRKAEVIANQRGKPLREKLPNGKVRELVGLDEEGELLYVETKNVNAAISTEANFLHSAPYSVDGSGLTVGVWDADSALVTHQEFNEGATSRVNNVNSQPFDDHSTHVAGTIAAFGVDPGAKGMAFRALIDSYDWTSDVSEMTAAGATGINQFESKVYLSNHSYGFSNGWRNDGGWIWTGAGTDQNAYDADFGQYSGTSANLDNVAYNAPYYLIFWAAGNENNDGPSNGNTVTIGGASVTYNSSIHPQNDGDYRNGFETIGDHGVAKNLITVGAANDGVNGSQRDPSRSTIASFSSTGPTDDGRIKPDLVGNGVGLRSPVDSSDTAYGGKSGTSMATPNLTGSAALLVALYRDLFGDGAAMRSSTLKALLIHTATDIGNPGPDYTYGWGLPDIKTAAELLQRQADFPDIESVVEDQLTTAQPVQSFSFSWDGVSEIRATLCWTDPAGSGESAHDDRTPDLVNDLNLKLIGPDGTEYYPFVMSFVGTWTVASMSQPATTGVNNTDNVEQVLVGSPAQAGVWQAEVSYLGTLTNSAQDYGLIISGSGTAGSVNFNPSTYTVSEGGSSVTITISRDGGSTGAVSVDYATSDGTAISGSDYTTTTGTLSWADGESGARTFAIPIINDGVSETFEETFSVTLTNPVGIQLSVAESATVTIVDDEPTMGVITPNGGEALSGGSAYDVTWASGQSGDVRIELLKNGIIYTTVAASTPDDGLFTWTVSLSIPSGSDYRIRITRLSGGAESDTSNGTFSISDQSDLSDIYTANMDTDPGWTLQGAWAYGVPAGSGGDPSSGNTGNHVIGYNLAGQYTNNLPETYATTLAIDCSDYTDVTLSFYRWLGIESSNWDQASIRVSNDGISWTTVWQHAGGSFTDPSWQNLSYDISAIADQQPEVFIRWVMGTTDGSVTFAGWNIDDVVISGMESYVNPAGEVAFSSASYQVSEGVGSALITVDRIGGTTGAISVDYATSDGTATAGADYAATSGTLNWADGDGSPKTFSITINDDADHEDFLETIQLMLSNVVAATLADITPATLTIEDNDNNAPSVDAGPDQSVDWQKVTPVPGLAYGTVPGNIDVVTPNPVTQILINVGSETENSIASNTTEIYTGNIYDADGQISFTENIDDKARIWIDGVLVLSNDAWSVRTSTANLNLAPGWHTIEIRISNGTGGSGPVSGVGIGYDPAGGTNWQTLVDPGDGSFLKVNQNVSRAEAILDGTVSDLDGDPLTSNWSLVSGPGSVTFADASSVDTTAQFDAWGVYTLRLTGDDGRGPVSDEVIITVIAPSLDLSYVGNGSTGGTAPEDPNSPYEENATVTVLGNTGSLVRTGHSFNNWNTAADGTGTAYAPDDTFSITNFTTLYAQWLPETYTVSYNGNGNTGGTAPADQTKSYDMNLTLSSGGDLTRTGYAFAGWNTQPDGLGTGYVAEATYTANAALTLYAQWNGAPTVNAGLDQTVYLGSSAPWSPSSLTTLAWYDAADATTITASGGTVSQWNDKSGNGRNIDQATAGFQPSYAASTVSLDGIDDYLWNDAPFMYANGQLDVFVVGGVAPTNDDRLLSEGSSTNINPLYCIAQTDNSNASIMSVYIRNDTGGVLSGQPDLSAAGTFDDTRQLYQWRDTGSQVSGRVNGGAATSSLYARSGSLTLDRFSMGTVLRSTTAAHVNADLNEIIICSNLTDADRQKMEGYLAHKWGLAADLPVGHPYKDAAPGSPTALAALNGTVNDPDSGPLTQQWTKQAGPAADAGFDDASAVDTNATFTEVGTYTLRLTADDGFQQAFDEVVITVELPPLTVSIADAEISEDGGTTTATISRVGTSGDLDVGLTSSDTGEATVPATATILSGNSSVDVTITGVPDGIVDDTQTVTITAIADNNVEDSDTVDVTHVDTITYTVTYDGNGNDGGSVPVDNTGYNANDTVTVPGNTGDLVKTGHAYNGWNTTADGSGAGYVTGETFSITEDVTLYAQWRANIAPIAGDQSFDTPVDTAVAITLMATDVDNDPLTYTVVVPPTHGSLVGAAPVMTYTPDVGYTGSDSFTFTANDGTDDSNTATVSISVLSPFEDWAGEGSSPESDRNGDGIADGIAWVLGANDPSIDVTSLLPSIDVVGAPDYMTFTYRRSDAAHNDSNTAIEVKYGSDLNLWTAATHDGGDVIITVTDDHYATGVDRVEVKLHKSLAADGSMFSRLSVVITP